MTFEKRERVEWCVRLRLAAAANVDSWHVVDIFRTLWLQVKDVYTHSGTQPDT